MGYEHNIVSSVSMPIPHWSPAKESEDQAQKAVKEANELAERARLEREAQLDYYKNRIDLLKQMKDSGQIDYVKLLPGWPTAMVRSMYGTNDDGEFDEDLVYQNIAKEIEELDKQRGYILFPQTKPTTYMSAAPSQKPEKWQGEIISQAEANRRRWENSPDGMIYKRLSEPVVESAANLAAFEFALPAVAGAGRLANAGLEMAGRGLVNGAKASGRVFLDHVGPAVSKGWNTVYGALDTQIGRPLVKTAAEAAQVTSETALNGLNYMRRFSAPKTAVATMEDVLPRHFFAFRADPLSFGYFHPGTNYGFYGQLGPASYKVAGAVALHTVARPFLTGESPLDAPWNEAKFLGTMLGRTAINTMDTFESVGERVSDAFGWDQTRDQLRKERVKNWKLLAGLPLTEDEDGVNVTGNHWTYDSNADSWVGDNVGMFLPFMNKKLGSALLWASMAGGGADVVNGYRRNVGWGGSNQGDPLGAFYNAAKAQAGGLVLAAGTYGVTRGLYSKRIPLEWQPYARTLAKPASLFGYGTSFGLLEAGDPTRQEIIGRHILPPLITDGYSKHVLPELRDNFINSRMSKYLENNPDASARRIQRNRKKLELMADAIYGAPKEEEVRVYGNSMLQKADNRFGTWGFKDLTFHRWPATEREEALKKEGLWDIE